MSDAPLETTADYVRRLIVERDTALDEVARLQADVFDRDEKIHHLTYNPPPAPQSWGGSVSEIRWSAPVVAMNKREQINWLQATNKELRFDRDLASGQAAELRNRLLAAEGEIRRLTQDVFIRRAE